LLNHTKKISFLDGVLFIDMLDSSVLIVIAFFVLRTLPAMLSTTK
jgi:hypothetical protein